jgi:DNA-binding transcriptional LysR family regulator
VDEPLVLINCGLGRKPADDRPLISIEASSATWTAVVSSIRQRYPQLLKRQLITVESFGATLQMVKAGFGDGLVPLGLLIEMGLDRRCYRELPGIKRSISLLTRKTIHQLTSFQVLRDELVNATANYFTRRVA